MTPHDAPDVDRPARALRVLVAVDGQPGSQCLIDAARRLASDLRMSWEAMHVETPETSAEAMSRAADVLGAAAQHGAAIASVPAGDVVGGLLSHLEAAPADYLVVGSSGRRRFRSTVVDRLTASRAAPQIVVVPLAHARAAERHLSMTDLALRKPPLRALGLTAVLVAATLLLALALQRLVGARVLDLLFLIPVMTVAARYGLVTAVAAAAMSVAAYNFFLMQPLYTLGYKSPLSVIMAIALSLVGAYTTFLTVKLRRRVVLSDRSAHQNASLAAFGQALANVSDWEATAAVVCDQVASLLKVRAAVLREKEGVLEVVAAVPAEPAFGPVDHAALDWTWEHGVASGSGTDVLAAADWQFQPLQTSLGRLAVLALARDTGRNPVRADQAVLLSTILAQASLAHERLRLEDQMRGHSP